MSDFFEFEPEHLEMLELQYELHIRKIQGLSGKRDECRALRQVLQREKEGLEKRPLIRVIKPQEELELVDKFIKEISDQIQPARKQNNGMALAALASRTAVWINRINRVEDHTSPLFIILHTELMTMWGLMTGTVSDSIKSSANENSVELVGSERKNSLGTEQVEKDLGRLSMGSYRNIRSAFTKDEIPFRQPEVWFSENEKRDELLGSARQSEVSFSEQTARQDTSLKSKHKYDDLLQEWFEENSSNMHPKVSKSFRNDLFREFETFMQTKRKDILASQNFTKVSDSADVDYFNVARNTNVIPISEWRNREVDDLREYGTKPKPIHQQNHQTWFENQVNSDTRARQINFRQDLKPNNFRDNYQDSPVNNHGHKIYRWSAEFNGDGTGQSVNEFLSRVEMFAKGDQVSENTLLDNIHRLLKGRAERWYWSNTGVYNSWKEFVEGFKSEFLPSNYEFLLREEILSRVQRNGESFAQYITDMKTLFLRAHPALDEQFKLFAVQKNMLTEYGMQVATAQFRTLEELVQMCKRIDETKLFAERRSLTRSLNSQYLVEPSCFPSANARHRNFSDNHNKTHNYNVVHAYDSHHKYNDQDNSRDSDRNSLSQQPLNAQTSLQGQYALDSENQTSNEDYYASQYYPQYFNELDQIAAMNYAQVRNSTVFSCWDCGEKGHGYTQCQNPTKKIFCHFCGASGFTIKTCPKNHPKPNQNYSRPNQSNHRSSGNEQSSERNQEANARL